MKYFTLSLLSVVFHHRGGRAFTQPAFSRIHSGEAVFFQGKGSRSYGPPSSSSSSLQLMDLTSSFPMTDFGASSFDGASTAPMLVSSNPNFESRFFGDLAHLILDFATICSPDTVVLRLLIFLGRVFSILSDYVPDHEMTYDEVLFQTTMLLISTNMFLKKFQTSVYSLKKDTSFQDRRIYKRIFYPAGFTFSQYRSLLSLNVLEWTACKPGQFIFEDESSLLITYKGSMHQHSSTRTDGSNASSTNTTYLACGGSYCYEIIGNISQAHETLESRRKRSPSKIVIGDEIDPSSSSKSTYLLRAGPAGATLLRINTKALLEKAGEDADITESIKNLYFNAMQKKLSSYTSELAHISNPSNKTIAHHFL